MPASSRLETAFQALSPRLLAFRYEKAIAVLTARTRTATASRMSCVRFAAPLPDSEYPDEIICGVNSSTLYAIHAPASAYIPAITPASPESDKNLDDRSIIERISARSCI